MSTNRHYVFIGDSTLENFHWVGENATVADQLRKVEPTATVTDLAMDGFTTKDVLNGASKQKVRVADVRHPKDMFYPLEQLKVVQASANKPTNIVLSVGGNDIREKLEVLILKSPEKRLELMNELIAELHSNYLMILTKLMDICPGAKISTMLQYTPCTKDEVYPIYLLMEKIAKAEKVHYATALPVYYYHRLFGRSESSQKLTLQKLYEIMAAAYKNIIADVRKLNIPILDMTSTFNHVDTSLYVEQIEPSAKGGALISRMISHVASNHNYAGPSCMYVQPYGKGDILSIEGTADWRPHSIDRTDKNAGAYFDAEYRQKLERDGWPTPATVEEVIEQLGWGNRR